MQQKTITKYSNFGEWLASVMADHNYTRQGLADALEVSKAAVDKWLANRCIPRLEHVLAICTLCYTELDTWQQYMYATAIVCSIPVEAVPHVGSNTSGYDNRRP